MRLHPQPIPPVPDETARLAYIAFQGGNRYIQLRDRLGAIFHDKDFSDLYPNVGDKVYAIDRHEVLDMMQRYEAPPVVNETVK